MNEKSSKTNNCYNEYEDFEDSSNLISSIPYMKSDWINIDTFKIKDYNPLVNSRAHIVGKQETQTILNQDLKNTYTQFLWYLAFKKEFTAQDKLIFVTYL